MDIQQKKQQLLDMKDRQQQVNAIVDYARASADESERAEWVEIASRTYANALRDASLSMLELRESSLDNLRIIAESAGFVENTAAIGHAMRQPFIDGAQAQRNGNVLLETVVAGSQLVQDPWAVAKGVRHTLQDAEHALGNLIQDQTNFLTMERRRELAPIYDLHHTQRIEALAQLHLGNTLTLASLVVGPEIAPEAPAIMKTTVNTARQLATETAAGLDSFKGLVPREPILNTAGAGVGGARSFSAPTITDYPTAMAAKENKPPSAISPSQSTALPSKQSHSQAANAKQEPSASQQTVIAPPLWIQRQHRNMEQAGFERKPTSTLETDINQTISRLHREGVANRKATSNSSGMVSPKLDPNPDSSPENHGDKPNQQPRPVTSVDDVALSSSALARGTPRQITHDDSFATFHLKPLAVNAQHEIPVSFHFPKAMIDPKTGLPPNFAAINAEMGDALRPNLSDKRMKNPNERLAKTEAVDVYYLGAPKAPDTHQRSVLNNATAPQIQGDRIVFVQRLLPEEKATNQAPVANIHEGSIRRLGDSYYNPTKDGASFSVPASAQHALSGGLASLNAESLKLNTMARNLEGNLSIANTVYPYDVSRWLPDQPHPSRSDYITSVAKLQHDMTEGIKYITEGYRDFRKPRNNVYTEVPITDTAAPAWEAKSRRSTPSVRDGNLDAFTSRVLPSEGHPPITLTFSRNMLENETRLAMPPPKGQGGAWTEVTLPTDTKINNMPKEELAKAIYEFVINHGGSRNLTRMEKDGSGSVYEQTTRPMSRAQTESISHIELIYYGPRAASEKKIDNVAPTINDNRFLVVVRTLKTDGTLNKESITLTGSIHPEGSHVYNWQVDKGLVNPEAEKYVVAGLRKSTAAIEKKLGGEVEALERMSKGSFGEQQKLINQRLQELKDTFSQFERAIEPLQPSQIKAPEPAEATPPAPKAESQASSGTLQEALAYLSEDSRRVVNDRINQLIVQQPYQQADAQLV